jgi:MYXO-CTERM domain-containing protein
MSTIAGYLSTRNRPCHTTGAGLVLLLLAVFFLMRRREPRVVELPSPHTRRLEPGESAAVKQALTQAGCTVGVKENEDGYSVNVHPIDGHGHFHHFQVFKDGRVGESACGHMDPMPEKLL